MAKSAKTPDLEEIGDSNEEINVEGINKEASGFTKVSSLLSATEDGT